MVASKSLNDSVDTGSATTFARAGKPYTSSWQTLPFLAKHFYDDVEWMSGWLHEFTCPRCSSFLRFIPDALELEKGRFQCSECDKWSSGDSLSTAWVYLYRQWYAEQLIVAATYPDKQAAADYICTYIDYYADNYLTFPIHGSKAGQGRIMAQSLDEAVFGIHLVRAIHYCQNLVPEEKLLRWRDQLFHPMVELLKPQAEKVHNISVWIWCFVGMVGLLFQDDALIEESESAEYGLIRQLSEGLTEDSLWREGSLHYHYYALEALTYLCELHYARNHDWQLFPTVEQMYLAPLGLSYDGYNLPSLNDGWYPLTLENYGPQIACAALMTKNPLLAQQAKIIQSRSPKALDDPGYQALRRVVPQGEGKRLGRIGSVFDKLRKLLGLKGITTDALFFNRHIGVIDKPFHILLKGGSIVKTHAHHDCLSIAIEPVSCDLGTPGYGSPINDNWYKGSLSHNTVSIDGSQDLMGFKGMVSTIRSGIEAELPGDPNAKIVKATRRLTRKGDRVADELCIECAEEHVLDWTLHLQGEVQLSPATSSADPLGETDAYKLFENVEIIDINDVLQVSCISNDGALYETTIMLDDGMNAYTAFTPGNPASERRQTILVRTIGKKARFYAEHRLLSSKH